MSTKKDDSLTIKNTDTLARREWIANALDRVRAHLNSGAFLPTTLESLGHEEASEQRFSAASVATEVRVERRKHPHIYVAWAHGERRQHRSGT